MAKQTNKQMSVAQEIKAEQKAALKNMTFKEKAAYFWEYYKVHVLVSAAAIAIVLGLGHDIMTSKDNIFHAMMLNSYGLDSNTLSTEFGIYADLDMVNYNCYIDTTTSLDMDSFSEMDVAATQMIMAIVQTGDLDVMVANANVFNNYANAEMFADLTSLYTEAELAPYQDHFYYIDKAAIAAAAEAPFDAQAIETILTPEEKAVLTESHRHPEEMETPIPVGVFLEDAALIKETGCYENSTPVFGIVASGNRPESTLKYLNYLWTTKEPGLLIPPEDTP